MRMACLFFSFLTLAIAQADDRPWPTEPTPLPAGWEEEADCEALYKVIHDDAALSNLDYMMTYEGSHCGHYWETDSYEDFVAQVLKLKGVTR